MANILEKLAYFSGLNYNFYNTKFVFDALKKNIPSKYFNCNVVDIGCGDGTNTLLISKALKSKNIIGYEINKYLVRNARQKGILVYTPQDKFILKGELGVLWGVVHHFNDPSQEIENIIKNFRLFIIREPTDYFRIFEAGKRYKESEMTKFIEIATKNCNKSFTKLLVPSGKSVLYFIE